MASVERLKLELGRVERKSRMGRIIKAGHVLEAEYKESEAFLRGLGLSGDELEAAVEEEVGDLMAHDRVRRLTAIQIRRRRMTIGRLKRALGMR